MTVFQTKQILDIKNVNQLLPQCPCIACRNLLTDCQQNPLADICPHDSNHNYSTIYLMGGPFFLEKKK